MENLLAMAMPTRLTCPDCGGTLSGSNGGLPLRDRCHTGHVCTARTLDNAQAESTQQSLQTRLRRLQERESLLRRLASVASTLGDDAQARAGWQEADRVHVQAMRIEEMLEDEPRSA